MRLPRVRFTVRRLMLLVAVIAVGLVLVREFGEGCPPRYVLCGIPGRFAQLRSGMTRRQAHEILGLKKSWIRGGLGGTYCGVERWGWMEFEEIYVRAPRVVAIKNEGGPSRVLTSSGMIRLEYHRDPRSTSLSANDESSRLARASFSVDGQTIAEMPMSP
jgi:hypothetical protein